MQETLDVDDNDDCVDDSDAGGEGEEDKDRKEILFG